MAFCHEHIILPLSDLLKGESVYRYLRLLYNAEQWTPQQMQDFQQQRLHKLLLHAAENVPFYRDWFREQGLNPGAVTLDRLPIVDKDCMRREGIGRFAAEGFSEKERLVSRSGGSTGEPFTFYESKLSYSVNMAAKLRTWYQAGYRMGDGYIKITNGVRANRLKSLQDWANNCLYIPFYSITDDLLESILERIERSKPLFIRSYSAPLYLLAKYRNRHSGYHHTPRHLFTTGSTLSEAYRDEMERAFGCDVIDSYSCEGTPNTYETPLHDGYTVCGYYGIIEVLDNADRPVTDGIGRVVSTDLWNFAHPFLRYDTQDLVEVSGGRIVRIMGRQCETLIQTEDKLLTVHNFTHYFADNFPSVDGWQVVKMKNGSIMFRLVVNGQYSAEDEKAIVEYWSSCVGVPVNIQIVSQLPLMANNKHLSIIEES